MRLMELCEIFVFVVDVFIHFADIFFTLHVVKGVRAASLFVVEPTITFPLSCLEQTRKQETDK